LIRLTKGNGTYTTLEYDGDGRLLHLVNLAPNSAVNSQFDYTYDVLGRRDSVTTLDGKTTYTYDTDSRLTSASLPNGRVLTYVYDAAGNRIGTTENGIATAYSANNLNEYVLIGATNESYDSAGNLLSIRGGANASYTYDSMSRLTGLAGAPGTYA